MADDKKTDLSTGLTDSELSSRIKQYGKNALREKRQNPLLKLFSHFWGPIPWMIESGADLLELKQPS